MVTNETEVDCDACFEAMAEFAECQLSGASVPDALVLIDDHIKICVDCEEQYQILKTTISEMDDLDSHQAKKLGH